MTESTVTTAETAPSARASGATLVLLTLATGQFLMTLDSSVMNVSIATVAKDVGTTVTGIQGAITAYTLVMAALMITGAKIGAMIGRKRAFAIGCVIYGCGSLTTALSPSLPVLLFGWSFLEGVGAALILPSIVALIAGNFAAERRPAAYGLVAAAGAVAVAVGPLVGLVLSGLFVIWIFFRWEGRRESHGEEPLVPPVMLRNRQLGGGLIMFFFQYLTQAGLFFVVPLFLSVCLGLSALATGARLLPLSITLLAAAIGVPRLFPNASPRFVVRCGLLALLAGTVVLLGGFDKDAGAEVVFVPMLLIGLGIGALASQLGAVTVSAVPDEQSAEVGGVQNTMTNLGASMGTALAGSILIAASASSFSTNIQQNPAIPASVKSEAQVKLAGGVPFVSDADLNAALEKANADSKQSEAALADYQDARIDGLRSSLAILAVLLLVALFYAQRIPSIQPGAAENRTAP